MLLFESIGLWNVNIYNLFTSLDVCQENTVFAHNYLKIHMRMSKSTVSLQQKTRIKFQGIKLRLKRLRLRY